MKIGGTLRYRGTEYFISLEENKSTIYWSLVTKTHVDDLAAQYLGQELKHIRLQESDLMFDTLDIGYVAEGLKKLKVKGTLSMYRNRTVLTEVLEVLGLSLSYGYNKDAILEDSTTKHQGNLVRQFQYNDGNLEFAYVRQGKMYSRLFIKFQDIELDMREGFRLNFPRLEYLEIQEKSKGKLQVNTLSALDYPMLKHALQGLTWYEHDGKILKDYGAIENIQQLEDEVISPILDEILSARLAGRKVKLGLDTETTGLIFYDLSDSNPNKDRLVAIPIAWKDNQSRVVFVDMEYFENVPVDYVLGRLRSFIEGENGKIRYTRRVVRRKNEASVSSLKNISSFGNSAVMEPPTSENVVGDFIWEDVEVVEFDREDIWLVGHNAPFDARVFYSYGIQTYWNDDTLQMSFNLNPRVVKGSNKLKVLSHRIFGVDTPELSDILGRGNEDKYRYIQDKQVAVIYGCADTDYTRLLHSELIRVSPPKLYKMYQKLDVPVSDILYRVEYEGMPIDQEAVVRDGEIVQRDMAKLKHFLYKYVGSKVDMRNQVHLLYQQWRAGIIDEAQYVEGVKNVKPSEDSYYEFELAGDDLINVLFDILKYPVSGRKKATKKYPTGRPAIDKFAIEKLMKAEKDVPARTLAEDLMSEDGKSVLLEAEKFNKLKHPIAYFLQVYKDLDKDWTSYYKPVAEQNMEGKLFKGFSMARIETRRIMNPGQTMKAKMKKNVISRGPDWYLADFDQMQAEPRIMISFSTDTQRKTLFMDPEVDYHTETAARIIGIPPHKLTKKVRKLYKSISLGLPYGIGPKKMCLQIHGKLTERLEYEVRLAIEKWQKVNAAMWQALLDFREEALKPADISPELREFLAKTTETTDDIVYGQAKNMMGFYRLFNLEGTDTDRGKRGKVERPAGNFPIQSTAAEIFRLLIKRLYARMKQEGLVDKIKWHMLIHDEILMSVHKTVHPFLLYKILYESCTVTFPGHTAYYIGINIGNSWADCKLDENEAPVKFVERVIEAWDKGVYRDDDYWNHSYTFKNAKGKTMTETGPKGYVLEHMHKYVQQRVYECVREIQPNVDNEPVDLPHLLENFAKYTVRSYVTMHLPRNTPPRNEKNDDDVYESQFETWVLNQYGEGKEMIGLDGKLKKVYRNYADVAEISMDDLYDELDLLEETKGVEENWTFDYEDPDDLVYGNYTTYAEEDEEEDPVFQKFRRAENGEQVTSVAQLLVSKPKTYPFVSVANGQLFVKVGRKRNLEKMEDYLMQFKADEGYHAVIETSLSRVRTFTVSKDIDLEAVNKVAEGLYNGN